MWVWELSADTPPKSQTIWTAEHWYTPLPHCLQYPSLVAIAISIPNPLPTQFCHVSYD